MTAPQTATLERAFREALQLPVDLDLTTTAYRVTAGWDSVAHMQLVSALEEAFGIMLDTSDVLDMSSWEKAVEILRKHGVDC